MMEKIEKRALEIRSFNRFYTNINGLMNRTILDSSYSLAEARILLEIDSFGRCNASDLKKMLSIDSGYLSRILSRFCRDQLIKREKSATDGRSQTLSLTDQGKQTVEKLYNDSTQQAIKILNEVPDEEQQQLTDSMRMIRGILEKRQTFRPIIRPLRYGETGYIAYRHCVLYRKEYGLGGAFEQYVLDALAAYIREQPSGEVWVAEDNGRIVGSIAMVDTDQNEVQLRWFLIEPEYRGVGLGRQLLKVAIDYCSRRKITRAFLWTFQELAAARHLYKEFGFVLAESVVSDVWKPGVIEERWDRIR